MSKDITAEFNKTFGEQSRNAKSHLNSAIVPSKLFSKSSMKPTNFMISLRRTSVIW